MLCFEESSVNNKFLLKTYFKTRPVIPDTMQENLQEYTQAQLALRNGADRPEIWCAYNGFIYDLTKSRLWRDGKHYEHWAGQDLTDELKNAPHTENVFDKFKIVGKLKKI